MYLFFSYHNGYIPCGNDGMMQVPAHVRSWKQLEQLARSWQGRRAGCVWLISTWTQEMSEMSPSRFNEYVARNGRMITCK